jgi:hypothetical protein
MRTMGGSRRTRSARLPDLEDPPRAEKANFERLEEVELSEQERYLIRIGPGQREAHRCKLPNGRLDYDTACANLRQGSSKRDVRLLGVPIEPKLNAERIGEHADRRAAVNQCHGRLRVGLTAEDDGQIRHQIQPTGSRVPIAVGKLFDSAHELVSSSLRSWASCAAAPGEYSGV